MNRIFRQSCKIRKTPIKCLGHVGVLSNPFVGTLSISDYSVPKNSFSKGSSLNRPVLYRSFSQVAHDSNSTNSDSNTTTDVHSTSSPVPLEYFKYTADMDILSFLKERGFISATTANVAKHFNSNIDISQESLSASIVSSTACEPVQIFPTDKELPNQTPVRRVIYAGFDPTADCLHMGNLLVIIALMHFHRAGHTVLPLVGGATGLVGDPTGRSVERVLLSAEDVARNAQGIADCLRKFLTEDRSVVLSKSTEATETVSPNYAKIPSLSPIMVNNLDWYGQMTVVDYLRDVGKYFRVAGMLAKDSVKKRMEVEDNTAGMSFTEFSYQTLQGYDFQVLKEKYGCSVQIGGSDQWGNITAGIEYVHRANSVKMQEYEALLKQHRQEVEIIKKNNKGKKTADVVLPPAPTPPTLDDEAHGLTLPLLTTSTGVKFGKSAGNALWLDNNKTSAYTLYQFMLQTTDVDVGRMLKVFTTLTVPCIDSIVKVHMQSPDTRYGQRILAEEVVKMIHGELGLKQALATTQLLFPSKTATPAAVEGVDGKYMGLNASELVSALSGVPSKQLPINIDGVYDISSLAVGSGIVNSKAEAKRLISAGGLYINNIRVTSEMTSISSSQFILGEILLLRSGQKKHHLVTFI